LAEARGRRAPETLPHAMAEQRSVSYDDTSSGCMTLLDGDGDATSFLDCVLGCLERPPEDDNERKPSQAAGDLLARAETEERRGAYGAASELYRRALRLDPANATAHNNFGYLCSTHTRDFANAEYHYKLAIECAPDYALAHNNLAYFLKKNKRDLAGAETHYREAIRCRRGAARRCAFHLDLLRHRRDTGLFVCSTPLFSTQVRPALRLRALEPRGPLKI